MRGRLVRLDHMGRFASPESVIANLISFGRMLRHHAHQADIGAATEHAAAIYEKEGRNVLF